MNEREHEWINKLLQVDFLGKEILIRQLERAKIQYIQEYSFISIKFKVEGCVELFPYCVRVPVEMKLFQSSITPIVFLLHVINGIIDELEIITADLSYINPDQFCMDKIDYAVDKKLI